MRELKTFDATKGEFCIPVIGGRIVPQCWTFTVDGEQRGDRYEGYCMASCHRLDNQLEPFALHDTGEPALITVEGPGYAVMIDVSETRTKYAELGLVYYPAELLFQPMSVERLVLKPREDGSTVQPGGPVMVDVTRHESIAGHERDLTRWEQ